MKAYIYTLGVLVMMLASCTKSNNQEQQAKELVVRYEFGLPIDSFRIDTCVVKDGETLGGMLNRLGASRQQITGITLMPRSEFENISFIANIQK